MTRTKIEKMRADGLIRAVLIFFVYSRSVILLDYSNQNISDTLLFRAVSSASV